jgi:putative endonuclease
LVRCSDESLYCGVTNDLEKRLATHNSGKGAKYTRSRRPVKLVANSSKMTKNYAFKLEYRVKHVPASKKYYELIKEEDKMAMDLTKTLNAVTKDLKALAKKVDRLIVAVDKLEKGKTAKKKAKTVKKVTGKKKIAKVKSKKKAPAKKKAAKLTAIDTVHGAIKRSKKGINTASLMKKTGFNRRKIYDTVKVLKKKGKVKSEGIGVYVKA